MTTTDFTLERARRMRENNERISPQDQLRLLAEDIDSGRIDATSIVIVAFNDQNESFSMSTRFSNVRMTDAVKVLELAKYSILRDDIFGG